MFSKKHIALFVSILLGVSTLAGCGAKEDLQTSDNKDLNYYSKTDNAFELVVDTPNPIYLDGFIYPYYYRLVNFEDEPKTVNAVQDKDEHGKFYPYSYSLCTNDSQKEFYRAFITAVYNMEPSIDCTQYKLSVDDVNTIFKRIVMEMPEFYYLDSTFRYNTNTDYTVKTVEFNYTLDSTTVEVINAQLAEISQSVKSIIPSSISRYDLYVWLHDFVVLNATYNDNYDGIHDSDVVGALIDHRGTCKSFAMAFEYLCRQYNITTCIVTGEVGQPHVWNMVPYGDDWFHIDVGMDNVDSEYAQDFVLHTFIGASDNWITQNAKHTIYNEYENSLYDLPACTNENLRFCNFYNFTIDTTSVEEAAVAIREELIKKLNSDIPFLEIKASNEDVYELLKGEVLNSNRGYLWGIIDDVNDALPDGQSIDISEIGCNFEKWDNSIILYVIQDN